MVKIRFFASSCLMLLFLNSCAKQGCRNTNPVFDRNAPDSKTYKDEFVKQYRSVDQSKLTYWMEAYKETDEGSFIEANVQGDGLCAKIVLSIKDSHQGIENILAHKGKGYNGSELEGLVFNIQQNETATEFVFEKVGGLND